MNRSPHPAALQAAKDVAELVRTVEHEIEQLDATPSPLRPTERLAVREKCEEQAARMIEREWEPTAVTLLDCIAKVEADHFRTVTDTGSNPNAMVVWNALRRAAGLPGLSKDDLPAYDAERKAYVCPEGSRLLVKPEPVPFNVPTS